MKKKRKIESENLSQNIVEDVVVEDIIVKKDKIDNYKAKECKVISYDKRNMALIVNFEGVNLRFTHIKNFVGDVVTIEYKGKIGRPNFEYKLVGEFNV